MACVPDDAIDRFSELTTGEERLYTRLCRFVCREEGHDDYGLAWPSRSKLAELMGCEETHISDLTTSLSRKGWVAKIGWKYRLLVGDFLLNSQNIPTIQPRKSRKKQTKTESKSRNIPTKSETVGVQLSESEGAIVGIQDSKSRNLGVQKSEFEPRVRKNQYEPVIEPEEPVSETRARDLDEPPFDSGRKPDTEFGTVIKWLEEFAAVEIQTPGSFARNLMKARDRDCERPIDSELYRKWILNCFEDVGPPGEFQDFDIWRREINTCLKNSRVAGRYCTPKKGNGNGQSKQNGFDESSRENARRLTATYDYYGKRLEAAREATRAANADRNGNSDATGITRVAQIPGTNRRPGG